MKEINLAVKNRARKKSVQKITLIALAVFLCAAVIAVFVLVQQITLSNNLAQIEQEIANTNAQISSMGDEKDDSLVLRERLSSIQKIFATRKKVSEKTNTVLSYFPDSLTIDTIKATDDMISVRVASPSLAEFENLTSDKINDFVEKNKIGIKRVDINGFGSNETTYFLQLDFYFTIKKV